VGGSRALIQKKRREGDQEILLRLLEHVFEDEKVSQAKFAERVGIAKGLANAYFNRCLQKGWIKLGQIPRRRYLYYLTPKGFTEKARLTAQFLTYSYQFYQQARSDLLRVLEGAAQDGCLKLGVLGCGELAEIAAIVSGESSVEIVGFVGKECARQHLVGRPVVDHWRELGACDAALLATLQNTKAVHDTFRHEEPGVRTYVPVQLTALLEG
jgi:hypothetical protein